jgi:hypothetical protein
MTGRFYRDRYLAHIAQWVSEQGKELEPDREQAETFLIALDADYGQFSFRTFSDSAYTRTGSDDPLEKTLHGSLSSHWDELVQLNRSGAVVTVTINRTNGLGRGISDISHVRALFIDDDLGGDPSRFSISPHIQVETSHNHYHYYWLVNDLPISRFQIYQQCLAKCYRGDTRVQALNQTMLLPGFWRRKKITNPRLSKLIKVSTAPALDKQDVEKLLGE